MVGQAAVVRGSLVTAAAATSLVAAVAVVYRPELFRLEVPVNPEGLAILIGAVALAVAIVRTPGAGLAVAAGLIFLNLSDILVRRYGLPSVLQFLAIPLVLAIWKDRARERVTGMLHLSLTWLLAAYVVVILVSTTAARDVALADERLIEHVKMLTMYVAVVALAVTQARIVVMTWVLIGAGCVLAAIGVIQSIGFFDHEFGGLGRIKYAHLYDNVFEPRIAGPLGDPNFFAQILLILVPMALALAWHGAGHRARWVALAVAGLLMVATVLTYSRGGALALGAVLVLGLLGRKHRWRELAAGAALMAAIWIVLPSDFLRRVTTLGELLPTGEQVLRPDASFEKRRLLVSAAWLMFLDHPVRGVGAANYTAQFDRYADLVGSEAREYDDPAEPHYPHTLYLEIAAETGLVGLVVFGLVVGTSFSYLSRARQAFASRGDQAAAALARGFGLALIGYLISSVFLHGHFLRYLWLLFACAAAMYRVSQTQSAVARLRMAEPARSREVPAAIAHHISAPAMRAAAPTLRRPIAVTVSRFPLVTETFILREIDELERQGQPVILVPLIRAAQPVVHREAQAWLERMLYVPFLSRGVVADNLRMLRRRPRRYVSLLVEIAAGACRSPNVLARTLALFPKTVSLAVRLEERGVRHVHAHFATYPATAAYVVWRLTDIGYSITAHAHDIFVSWRRASLCAKVRHARFVRAVSEFGAQHLRELCGDTDIAVEVIRVGVDPDAYLPRRCGMGDAPMLLCVAALKPYKGLAVLLEACHRLREAGVPFRCEIIGEGPLRADVERLRAQLRLDDCVTLRGALRQDEVASLLFDAAVVVAPSVVAPDGQMDGIPVALMEAMAVRCPVVASRLSGIPELVEDGVTGLLVEPGNPADLAAALQRLLADDVLAARMGARGREKVEREFRQQAVVAALLERIDRYNPPVDDPDASWQDAVRDLLGRDRVGIRGVHARPDSTIVELMAVNGGPPRDLVLKIHGPHGADGRSASERARHEYEVLASISKWRDPLAAESTFSYGAPRVMDLAGAALLMERCAGPSLVDVIRRGRGHAHPWDGALNLRRALRETGSWLRVFQAHTVATEDAWLSIARLVAQVHGDLRVCGGGLLDARHAHRIRARVDALAAALVSSPPRVVGRHGDFWPGNVFVDRRCIEVIDFEAAGDGLPYEDVGYFLVHLELFFLHPLHRTPHAGLRTAFLEGYLDGGPLDERSYELCRTAAALQMLAKRTRRSRPASWGEWWRLRAIKDMAVHAS